MLQKYDEISWKYDSNKCESRSSKMMQHNSDVASLSEMMTFNLCGDSVKGHNLTLSDKLNVVENCSI